MHKTNTTTNNNNGVHKMTKETNTQEYNMRGTYSLEDNKLRLYPSRRLDQEEYKRFKNAGFKWAPKQELFVAPMWTPSRFDLLLEFCGNIEDEEQSLTDRAEERANRFKDYSEKRSTDSDLAYNKAKGISNNIPFGQPILVGHYSESRHRNDAQRIDANMKKSIEMQRTSDYWKGRAESSICNAEYKGRADVRVRRIKKLGAEMRKHERCLKDHEKNIELWKSHNLNQEKAEVIAGGSCYSFEFYFEIKEKKITFEEAKERGIKAAEYEIERAKRWIAHYQLRIQYETNVIEQQGGADLLKPKPRAKVKQPTIRNYDMPVLLKNIMYGGEAQKLDIERITKAEWANVYNKHILHTVDNLHRVRVGYFGRTLKQVFLTDSKAHEIAS